MEVSQTPEKNNDKVYYISESPEYIEMIISPPKKTTKLCTEILEVDLISDDEEENCIYETNLNVSSKLDTSNTKYSSNNSSSSEIDFSFLSDDILNEELRKKPVRKKRKETRKKQKTAISNELNVSSEKEISTNIMANLTTSYTATFNFIEIEKTCCTIQKPKHPSHSEIVILIDKGLTDRYGNPDSTNLNSIHSLLTSNKRFVFPTAVTSLSIPQSIEWRRISPSKFKKDETELVIELNSSILSKSKIEDFLIIPLLVSDLFSLASEDNLEEYCTKVKHLHPKKQITFLVIGISRWIKCNSRDISKTNMLEDAIIWLQFESGCHIHQSETNVSAVNFIELFSESISEAAYKYVSFVL